MNKRKLIRELEQIRKIANGSIVYILGHKVTDVDSYISMILVERLLKEFGINAVPSLLIDEEAIDKYTKKVIDDFNCKYINNEIITNPEDITFAETLLKELWLDIDSLKKRYLIPTNLNQPIPQLSLHGLKEYRINGHSVASSYIEYFAENKEYVYSKVQEIKNFINTQGYDLFVLILTDLTYGKTEVIFMS